jgi:hypothetical protein
MGQNFLHLAVLRPPVLSLLIEHGGQEMVNSVDKNGVPPIIYAVMYGIIDSIDILLDHGANIHASVPASRVWDLGIRKFDAVSVALDCFFDGPEVTAFSTILSYWRNQWAAESKEPEQALLESPNLPNHQDLQGFGSILCGWRLWESRHTQLLHKLFVQTLPLKEHIFTVRVGLSGTYDAGMHFFVLMLAAYYQCQTIQSAVQIPDSLNLASQARIEIIHHVRDHATTAAFGKLPRDGPLAFPVMRAICKIVRLYADAEMISISCKACHCKCSANGCTTLINMLVGQDSLATIPLLLEWFIAIQAFRPLDQLNMACLEFFRLQRFEELGIRHICRMAHMATVECCSPDLPLGRDKIDTEDLEEILDEDSTLVGCLEEDCHQFKQNITADLFGEWIEILARRCVFIEHKARVRDDASSKRRQEAYQNQRSTTIVSSQRVSCSYMLKYIQLNSRLKWFEVCFEDFTIIFSMKLNHNREIATLWWLMSGMITSNCFTKVQARTSRAN